MVNVGIKDVINGFFIFGFDGNFLIGLVSGMKNYWVVVGVMVGFCQGGGVGLIFVEWMIDGELFIDVWVMDVVCFGEFVIFDWGIIKLLENYECWFVMIFLNEILFKGCK